MEKGFDLPAPGPDASTHSRRLAGLIDARIDAAGGWIDFGEFMDLALYTPGLGYYSAGAVKFGPAGDFVTAPEISPLLARCLARACVSLLRQTGGGVIMELGGGTGALAAQLLTAMQRLGVLPSEYLMLEPSADLRERQRGTIARLAPAHITRVRWLDELPAPGISGIILANEVADALPFSRFVIRGGTPWALGVARDGNGFCWAARPAPVTLAAAVKALQADLPGPMAEGYVSEVSLRLPAWLASLGNVLGEGVLFLTDYGLSRREYYHPDRRHGTLICHYRHRSHTDPFRYPGLQDISAWVDFTAVAQAAVAAGFRLAGYATQAHFLLAAGIATELAADIESPGRDAIAAASAAKRLLLPAEMGELFKVMALARGRAFEVPGYTFRDLSHTL